MTIGQDSLSQDDLPRLRILETWLALTLTEVRRAIAPPNGVRRSGSAASMTGRRRPTGCWSRD
ncbi:hypothetical protein SHO565_32710 [Streptomyces sp. HO565]